MRTCVWLVLILLLGVLCLYMGVGVKWRHLCVSFGTPFSQLGMVWAMCICDVGAGFAMVVPSLAS